MTFNAIALKYSLVCKNLISEQNPTALDIGCQTPSFTQNQFKDVLKKNLDKKTLQNSYFNSISSDIFTTKNCYLSMGYSIYESIDVNGYLNSYKFDLNYDLSDHYNFKNEYDLVINNGTGEHIFNQFSLYKNIHNLTKKGGMMLNILPCLGFLNHGFYNYHPLFFADLAASNDYEFMRMALADRNGNEVFLDDKKNNQFLFDHIKSDKTHSLLNQMVKKIKEKNNNILLVTIYRKLSSNEFKVPLQGKYLKDIKDHNSNYKSQKSGSANSLEQNADKKKRK